MVDIYQEKSEKLKSGVKISQIFLNSKNSQQNSENSFWIYGRGIELI